jgi:spore germination protein GerM
VFEGPNSAELQAQLRTAIPPGTRLLDVSQDGSELTVNVSNDLQQLTGEALIDGVAQIVLTASAITGVSSVSITIDGVRQQWPSSNGELQSKPLTRYDFPGLVVSSQPAFPSVPSPSAPSG